MWGIPKRSQRISVPFAGVAPGAGVTRVKAAASSVSVAMLRWSVFIALGRLLIPEQYMAFIDRKGPLLDDGLLGESSVVVYGEAKTGLILVNAAHGTQVDGFVGIARGAQKRVKSARHGRSTTVVHDMQR